MLLSFPQASLQGAIQRQLQAIASIALGVLLGVILLGSLVALVIARPIARLDSAVGALESYDFKSETLNSLAKRQNELGRVARLLQRMADAEEGWRRSLEGLRQAKEELEGRVEERTRDLKVALDQQTTLNQQQQELGAGLQQSVSELKGLAEVSQAINSPTVMSCARRSMRS